MGHLREIKREHAELVRRLAAGSVALPEPKNEHAWKGWRDILEILFSPEEASLAVRLPVFPASLEVLAQRTGTAPHDLRVKLDAMCDKGLVIDLVHPETGAVKYALAPPVVGFFEFSMMRASDSVPKKRLAEALEAYTRFDDEFAREVFGTETVVGRALVHESAWGDEGDEVPSDVLDWERATAILSDATSHAVSLCYCRHKADHLGHACDAEAENCLSINMGADFVLRRGFGRAINKTEALEILHRSREHGLVQIADNVLDRPAYVCNCCGCCCGQLQGINDYDLAAVNPSGFVPTVDLAKCKGCSRCSRVCPVTAVSMSAQRVQAHRKNALKPHIDTDRCIGCGVCADACKAEAMRMVRGTERASVPKNRVEQMLRMAMERGRLGNLLFDEGAGRGSRFLHQVFQALVKLPTAQKVLASEQVRSRFVSFALRATAGNGY